MHITPSGHPAETTTPGMFYGRGNDAPHLPRRSGGGEMVDYTVPVAPGMVVLDAIHEVQARHAPDLAVRWNCKAGRAGRAARRSTAGRG